MSYSTNRHLKTEAFDHIGWKYLIHRAIYTVTIALSIVPLTVQAVEKPSKLPQPSELQGPNPQLEQLQYFQGTWACTATAVTIPFYEKREAFTPVPFTWTVKRVLNDYWFIGQEEDDKGVTTTHDTLGFNTLTKRFGRTVLTNDGQFVNMLSSGWVKRAWVWEGSAIEGTGKTLIREMVEKQGDQAFISTYFAFDAVKKEWHPFGSKFCKKSS